ALDRDLLAAGGFLSPLIKPDVRISRIRLSDRFHRKLTEGVQGAHPATAARPTSRIQLHPSRDGRRGRAPCVGAAEKTEHHGKRTGRPLDRPSAAFRNRSNLTTLATPDSGDPAPRSTVPRSGALADLPLSAATWKRSSSTDSPRDTRAHSSACDGVRSCIPENQTALSVPASRWSSPRSARDRSRP